MSTGQLVGGVIGGIAGFMMGPAGWTLANGMNGGFAFGAEIGMQVGNVIEPAQTGENEDNQAPGKGMKP